MPWIIQTVLWDTTPCHWWPMLNCPFNSNSDFTQSCLIQSHAQIDIHWHPMLNCLFLFKPWCYLVSLNSKFCIFIMLKFSPWKFSPMIPLLNFHWIKVHFIGPVIAPILDYVTLPMGFPWVPKSGWFSHFHSYLLGCSTLSLISQGKFSLR